MTISIASSLEVRWRIFIVGSRLTKFMSQRDKQIAECLTTADLWELMMQRVPPIVSEYFRGGADEETTLRGNVRAFQQSMTTAYGALAFLLWI